MKDPGSLEVMQALAAKRFKVKIIYKAEAHFTVMARDPNHAVQLIKEGQGRPAGTQEPEPVAFQVLEEKGGKFGDSEVLNAAGEEEKREGLIKVVS